MGTQLELTSNTPRMTEENQILDTVLVSRRQTTDQQIEAHDEITETKKSNA
jgi:hypothetical protein